MPPRLIQQEKGLFEPSRAAGKDEPYQYILVQFCWLTNDYIFMLGFFRRLCTGRKFSYDHVY